MHRGLAHVLAVAVILSATPLAAAVLDAGHGGAVTNGGFELPPVTRTAETTLESTPAAECYGVGHQVRYGSQTPQAEATGGPFGAPDPAQADPVGAAVSVVENPESEVDDQTACVWNTGEGKDVAFLDPEATATRPHGWLFTLGDRSVEFGYDFDQDLLDREAKILADDSRSAHNLWQWFGTRQQAFTPNADALEIDVESGSISENALVRLDLEPAAVESYKDATYRECTLTFEAPQLQDRLAEGEQGHLAADPTNATFDARHPPCQDLQTAWNDAATQADKRAVLAQTRIVELGFWNWNEGTTEPTVIDDVRLTGASLLAEEIAAGNVTVS